MIHGDLFSGIGGFSLAARWAGWSTSMLCEINPFDHHILKHHFPDAKIHSDIRKTDFTFYRGSIDVLTGGFPCQPFSQAGKRKGTDDERHLWPEMLRAIREIAPRWIVGENVRGLLNWDGGMAFEQVCIDLESEGYEVQPVLIPACAINAPHRRDRVWIVAHRANARIKSVRREGENAVYESEFSTNTTSGGGEENNGGRKSGFAHEKSAPNNWQKFPTQSPICGGGDGIPTELDGITFSKWRNESISGYGNAVVPQVPLQIFKTINEIESQSHE
jgi:DNA (cytosine-5)-methyltransferase 1